jgi:uncharacterized membrane protein YkvA (DUF1232 family)
MKDWESIIKTFTSKFSEKGLFRVIKNQASKLGSKVIYTALLLFYAYKRKDTPIWAKNIIIGALGYLISPIDMLPDLTPILGYTDDLGILSFGLVTIASYINSDIRTEAKVKMTAWFPKWNESDVLDIDMKL